MKGMFSTRFSTRDYACLIWREKRVCPYRCGFVTCEDYVEHCFSCKSGSNNQKETINSNNGYT